jgi:ATP-dependent helicase HepA
VSTPPPSRYNVGDEVQSRADATRRGIVRELGVVFGGQQYYSVFWGSPAGTRTVGEQDLAPVPKSPGIGDILAGSLGGYSEFQRLITLQRLVRDQPLRNNIYAFNASRTRFFPYQFKPLLKFLDSDRHRLLICDEVGLGKTIEAGLILLELRARQEMRHVLVVCPSNLRPKWRYELKQRFGEDFRVLDASAINAFFDDYVESPERVASLNGIVSLETLRSQRTRQRLEELEIPFDLVIVDEAHHLRGFSTAQRSVGMALSRAAGAMLMLTATPVHLGQENLFSLLNVLDEEDFPELTTSQERFRINEFIVQAQSAVTRRPPEFMQAADFLQRASESAWFAGNRLLPSIQEKVQLLAAPTDTIANLQRATTDIQRDLTDVNLLSRVLTRTRKRDVHEDVATRRAKSVIIELTQPERALYEAVTELIRREAEKHTEPRQNLLWRLNTPQRRYSSSIQGMVEFYREQSVSTEGDDPEEIQRIAEAAPTPEEASEPELRALMRRLAEKWPKQGLDSKYEKLRKVLATIEEYGGTRKVIIFASFRHTIRYLERRLRADGIGVVAISGETAMEDRPKAVSDFRDRNDVQVLLSSRVGSEGLDFQFCSTIVNYDLPWNPMEVEQRIGRVDRIGQKSPWIAIINFWTVGTIEERILMRLYERIGIFERSIGDLEAILGDVSADFEREMLRGALHPEESEEAAERLGRIIENRRIQIEQLERSAASFVGVDSFFDDEVEWIRRGRRYVTGDQLRMFVTDFLKNEAPRTRLRYDSGSKRGVLVPDEQLKTFLRKSGRLSEALAIAGSVGASIPLTFDAQAAHDESALEFINVLHPLVTAIVDLYRSREHINRAFHVALRTSSIEAGFYFFFVYRLSVTAARPYTTLEGVVLNDDLELVRQGPEAEALLGELVERGESSTDPVTVDAVRARDAVAAAEKAYLEYQLAVVESERITNDAFVDQRLATLNAFYRKNIHRKQDLLTRAELGNRDPRYIRMLRSEVARLEGERETKTGRHEELRHVAAEHVTIASGVLEVVAPADGRRPS